MKIAIVGFPGCGKSTCFKAITGKTKDESEKLDPTKPHLGVVKIPDPRLEKLKTIFNPKKLTAAEIVLEDMPGFNTSHVKDVEALMEVLGAFSGRDPVKDLDSMDLEFMLADLEIINKRLPGLEKELKDATPPREKLLERDTLIKCREALEKNTSLRNFKFATDEEKEIRGFQFLSKKPVFILGNIAENQKSSEVVKKIEIACKEKGFKCIEFSAKLEAEIVDLDESEREGFLKELGIGKSARQAVIELAYNALGYITFFTVKGAETKAWSVKGDTTAIEAAGKIHSDMQKGFIKAEVINFGDLASSGGVQEARKKALLRLESKEYRIKDGDIIDFRFNK